MPGLCPVLGPSTALVHLLFALIDRWGDLPKGPQQGWAPFRALALPHDTLLPTSGRERLANSAHAMGSCLGKAVPEGVSPGFGDKRDRAGSQPKAPLYPLTLLVLPFGIKHNQLSPCQQLSQERVWGPSRSEF